MGNLTVFLAPIIFISVYIIYDYKKYGNVQKSGMVSKVSLLIMIICALLSYFTNINRDIIYIIIILAMMGVLWELIFKRKRN